MENPFKRNLALEFVKNFTSPLLGNVWIGRKADVRKEQAERLIAGGYAVLDEGASVVPVKPASVPAIDLFKGMTAKQKKEWQKSAKERAEADKAAIKAAKEQAEADKARVDELIGLDGLSSDQEAELAVLEKKITLADKE